MLNVSTINALVQETKEDFLRKGKDWRKQMFIINRKEIIPLYDVPHLIKGVRNNLLNKEMEYFDETDKNVKLVKWVLFRLVYEVDKSYGELRYLQKITDEHIHFHFDCKYF